ncbi:hypothetical protein ACLB1S_22655 [Escherichia coli]
MPDEDLDKICAKPCRYQRKEIHAVVGVNWFSTVGSCKSSSSSSLLNSEQPLKG